MISGRMIRPLRLLITILGAVALASLAAACGTEKISIPKDDPNYQANYEAAHLFQQRCSGCHTFNYAATMGSAANVRTKQAINGPNFNVRCERPVDRVLYAIENGGFSGAYMPANIFVGAQARQVAQFVATYAGRGAPKQPGVTTCQFQPLGTLPPPTATAAAAAKK
jgi:mono/diheme cytochrome c family protein